MDLVVSWRQAPLPSLAEPAAALAVLVLVVAIAVCMSRRPSTGRVVAGVLVVAVVLGAYPLVHRAVQVRTTTLTARSAVDQRAQVDGQDVRLVHADRSRWIFVGDSGRVWETEVPASDGRGVSRRLDDGRLETSLEVTDHWVADVVVPDGEDRRVLLATLRQMKGDVRQAPDGGVLVCGRHGQCRRTHLLSVDGDVYVRVERD